MHGRRSKKKAKRYRRMTSIWSCSTTAHADLGTNSTGSIQCRQYIVYAGELECFERNEFVKELVCVAMWES